MKNWICIFIIGLMGSLVSSCQQSLDEEVQLPITTGKAQITFTIALDDIDSRAAWEDNENSGEVGTTNDNLIADEVEILVHYTKVVEGEEVPAVEALEINNFYKVANTENIYKVEGELLLEDISTTTLDCKLEVFANCTSEDETFSYKVTNIPMWGEKQTELRLAKGELTQITDPIYLLRAMAKVEVLVAEGVGLLQSVTVSNYNPTGYVLPKFPETLPENYDGTEDLDQETVFNPYPVPETLGANLGFTPDENGGFYVYLPEYQNVDAAGNKLATAAQMTVQIDGKTYPLEFKIYSDGTPFDIVRNHYYRYIITDVVTQKDAEVTLNYDVIVGTPQEIIIPPFE